MLTLIASLLLGLGGIWLAVSGVLRSRDWELLLGAAFVLSGMARGLDAWWQPAPELSLWLIWGAGALSLVGLFRLLRWQRHQSGAR